MNLLRKTKEEHYANLDERKTLPMIKFQKTVKPIHCKLLKPQFDKTKFKWPPLQIPRLSPEKFCR